MAKIAKIDISWHSLGEVAEYGLIQHTLGCVFMRQVQLGAMWSVSDDMEKIIFPLNQ